MGRDKALLPWPGGDLLDHAVARLQSVTGDVRILAGAEARYLDRHVPVEVDAAPDLGPLAGLLAALSGAPEAALLLGVDLPLIPVALLRHLAELGREDTVDAVVPVSRRGPEPLCALYRATCLEAVRRHAGAGQLKMTGFWPDVRLREVPPDELVAFGDPDELFLNVNTPGDYEHALACAR